MGSSIIRAPRLEGVYGKPVPLQGGQVVIADDKYIRDSILLPGSQIAAGYANVMPSFAGHVSEEQLLQIIAYIKSLGRQATTGGNEMNRIRGNRKARSREGDGKLSGSRPHGAFLAAHDRSQADRHPLSHFDLVLFHHRRRRGGDDPD